MKDIEHYWYELAWRMEVFFKRIRCFLLGHSERPGSRLNYEEDYCPICHILWPQDAREIPKYLTRIYVWLVNREWTWFNEFDVWMFDNHRNLLPRWWEY